MFFWFYALFTFHTSNVDIKEIELYNNFVKELFNSKDFDFRKIIIEVLYGGSADASLMALKTINKFQGLLSNAQDPSRRERVQLWATS